MNQGQEKQWRYKFRQWLQSGLNGKDWCRQNDENYGSFYYWHNKLYGRISSSELRKESFIEIRDEEQESSGIDVYVGKIAISLSCDFNAETLKKCVKALMEVPC